MDVIDYVSTTDSRWEALLDEVHHDVYHLPQYLEVCATYEDAQPARVLRTRGKLLLPDSSLDPTIAGGP
ncbi:MAG: hypothetical protein ACR2IV_12515 [Bryobacteraceae bacterium]